MSLGVNPYISGLLICCSLLGLALLLLLILKQHTEMEKELILFISAAVIAASLVLSLLNPLLGVCSSAVYFLAGFIQLLVRKRASIKIIPPQIIQPVPDAPVNTDIFPERKYKFLHSERAPVHQQSNRRHDRSACASAEQP